MLVHPSLLGRLVGGELSAGSRAREKLRARESYAQTKVERATKLHADKLRAGKFARAQKLHPAQNKVACA